MFKKHSEEPRKRRKKNPVMGIFRTFLSLIMISVLGIGIYSAYRSFSGVDPLKLDPGTALNSLSKADPSLSFLSKVSEFNPGAVLGLAKISLPGVKPSSSNPTVSSTSSPTDEGGLGELGGLGEKTKPTPRAPLQFKFAVMGDSHNDNSDLTKGLAQAKAGGAKFVVGSGDYTDVGTVDDLSKAKQIFASSGLSYYLIPGDHDLWDSRNRGLPALSDFNQVMGQSYQSVVYENTRVILVDNSDNYLGISQAEGDWLNNQLANARSVNTKLVMIVASTPFFHPSSDHFMGKVDPGVKAQADSWVTKFSQTGVNLIMAGDTHFFSNYNDPRNNLNMIAVGAITADRNLQKPRYVMVDVYTDGSYNIEDTEVAGSQ